jgi:NADH dehydrogenase FAD-containing subunit
MARPPYHNVLLLGAGHGHLDLLEHLGKLTRAGVDVTVVSPEPVGLYSGMLPGLMGDRYTREEISLPVARIAEQQGATFIEDQVAAISAAEREATLSSGRRLSFDVLSIAMGSVVATERLPSFEGSPEEGVFPIKPYENVEKARERVREVLTRGGGRAVIVGGGPAAVELAGNLARFARRIARDNRTAGALEVALVCGGEPLAQFPEGCRRKALRALAEEGVHLCRGPRATRVAPGRVELVDGVEEEADIIILAPGVKPPPVLAQSDLPTAPDGGVAIDERMRAHTEAPVFAAGDSSHLSSNPLARIGAHALRGGQALRKNLTQLVLSGDIAKPARYSPKRGVFLALNLGDGRAAACFHGSSLFGRWVFAVKELIDTSFVRRTARHAAAQAFGENRRESVAAR